MKESALFGYASRWRGVGEERRARHTTWHLSSGSRAVRVRKTSVTHHLRQRKDVRSELHPSWHNIVCNFLVFKGVGS